MHLGEKVEFFSSASAAAPASGANYEESDDDEVVIARGDNGFSYAITVSFFGTLKRELVHHCSFKTRKEAQCRKFRYVEGFYNPKRLHSAIGYLSLEQFEQGHFKMAA